MKDLLKRIWNSSFAWGAGVAFFRAIGFLFVMGYALKVLTPDEIGLWYVMLNIAGLASAVDFGFSSVIARHASYYLGGVDSVPEKGLVSTIGAGQLNASALAGLIRMASLLYRRLALLMGAGMILAWGGWWAQMTFLQQRPISLEHSLVFLCFAIGSCYGMAGFFWPQVLFGLNRVRRFQQYTVIGLLANYLLAGLCLRMGAGILALALGQICFILLPRFLSQRTVLEFLTPGDFERAPMIHWWQLWPMTWRAGVLNVSSFLVIQNLPFFCSWFTDLSTTASFGLTLQLAIMLHGLSALWAQVKHPEIMKQRATGNLSRVRLLFRNRLLLGMGTYAAGSICLLIAGPFLLSLIGAKTGILPTPLMFALLLLIGLDLFAGAHSAILSTGNETPHLPAYLVGAILFLALFWPMGSRWGLPGILASTFLGQLAMNYWWTPWQCWKRLYCRQKEAPGL